ncbi:Subtilisin inhibitor-like protein 1 [Choanephora cucurbitarum]|uniref:Subtilisin inhibitor-like protein 1 n=1 Tax=Choanephora cucurbitarum TaxID=101091 RepID=A0A1C7NV11_9FUNG|nr:Subtilisin inhibitor-like protein 1 [Choanephora cucurbitarum]
MFKLTLCLLASLALFVSAAPGATSDRLTISCSSQKAKYTLSCSPVGGNHPHRQEACKALKRCGGNLNSIPPTTTICSSVFAPVTVTVEGTYGGKAVNLQREYENPCAANAHLGPIVQA